ncbi:MAG: hypothetical protein WBG73_16115 [Coleofasciculaceae cyanobacterium]
MKQKKAIVTLAIGQHYRDRWHKLCANNWHKYADLRGYDLICIDNPLDDSSRGLSRSAAWQKCLILGDQRVQKYNQVVWLDSDILINPDSPCVVSKVPEDKVGAVDMFARLNESLPGENKHLIDRHSQFWQSPVRTPKDFYSKVGLPDVANQVVQTGVMVLSPHHHRSVLENTYYNYEDLVDGHFEMESLSYEIIKSNCVHWLDSRFNILWIECMLKDYPFLLSETNKKNKLARTWKRFTRGHYQLPPRKITEKCLTTSFINNYFLHFAGVAQYMPWVNIKISSWSDI